MPTSYPSALDSLTNPSGASDTSTLSHAGQHANANDAIEAIETELGTDPAGTASTVSARIAAIEAIHAIRCRATRSTAQSINNSSWTAIQFTSENLDPYSMHDNVTNPDRVTIPAGGDGLYLIVGNSGSMGVNASGVRGAALTKNGVPGVGTYLANDYRTPVATIGPAMNMSAIVQLVAGDYVQLSCFQTSGGALDANNNGQASLAVIKLF